MNTRPHHTIYARRRDNTDMHSQLECEYIQDLLNNTRSLLQCESDDMLVCKWKGRSRALSFIKQKNLYEYHYRVGKGDIKDLLSSNEPLIIHFCATHVERIAEESTKKPGILIQTERMLPVSQQYLEVQIL